MKKSMLLALVPALLVACAESQETKLQRFLLKGNEELKRGNDQQALYYFNESLNLDSCFADALNNMGTIHYRQGKFDEAAKLYTRAIECQPAYLDAYFNRANAFYETKEYYRALADLDVIRKSKPDTLPLMLADGLIQTRLRKFDKAAGSFEKALAASPDNAELLVNLASVWYYQKKFADALRLLDRALALQPALANAYNTKALIQLEIATPEEALVTINRALALNADDAFALNNRGYVYLQLKQYEKAREDIDASILADPTNAWAYRNKGIYYLLTGDKINAVRLLQQAGTMDPFVEDIDRYLREAGS